MPILQIKGAESIISTAEVSVGTALTQLSATTLECSAILIKADPTNAGTVYIGNSSVGTAGGFPLVGGEIIDFSIAGVDRVWAIASAASQKIRYLALERY